jgi:hypothetical protein
MMAQAQDSLTDQLRRLTSIADDKGLYDAADWIRDRLAEKKPLEQTCQTCHHTDTTCPFPSQRGIRPCPCWLSKEKP